MTNTLRPPLKGQNCLVLGGAGFIGSHLADSLLETGAKQVVVVDNFFLGSERNLTNALSRGAVLYREDGEIASSLDYIFSKHQPDVVFNCATKALGYSFLNPANAFETNTRVLLNLLELQRKKAFKSLCHFSSSEVYGTAQYTPMDEKHPKTPTTTYAAGKAAADLLLESYEKMWQLDCYIVRPFNNYGPRQNFLGPLAGVIPNTFRRILQKQNPEIHGTGDQKRDFIYVKDTVKTVLDLHQKMVAGDSVNIAAENSIKISEVIRKCCQVARFQGKTEKKPERTADVQVHDACTAKLKALIDLRPTPFDVGLKETFAWLKSENLENIPS